ncbi:hypothetical protein E0H73_00020 [Kribbella pittospori]|uniref:Mycothiol-dependent maleylpyruvate isomerase metal-binding domain-containing protein n=1 Tax=Kribbella pittospori TaxID=722689 RepID=A0A4R0L3F0_9ACTN|nr:hypothetical protein [Kribbella pittospori]TCC65378.1 hypothetical protein E0H73_00020 [Kribbella pittospori]
MTFTCEDLHELTRVVTEAWGRGLDRDWSARAGLLEWSCSQTADHTVDTVFAPAIFLASRNLGGYPEYRITTPGPDADPLQYIEALQTATRVLSAVVRDADSQARAVIWRRPRVETRGPADFVPRGGLELILHGQDVCAGLNIAFDPPDELCERLRRHTESWPMWHSPGWTALRMEGPAWTDLLRASGR